jgi:hypothetical protein
VLVARTIRVLNNKVLVARTIRVLNNKKNHI